MSFRTTPFRPYARGAGGWPMQFRGALQQPFRGQIGTVVYRSVGSRLTLSIVGIAYDSTGTTPLAGATLKLLRTVDDVKVAETISDAAGNFRFDIMPPGPYRIDAYKVGSPDLTGSTVNTLQATPS